MPQRFDHIFLHDEAQNIPYTSTRSGGHQTRIPERNRQSHSQKLIASLDKIWEEQQAIDKERTAVSKPTRDGMYIEFCGSPGYDLKTKSLEDRRAGIRLLNIREKVLPSDPNEPRTCATVYVPNGKHTKFIQKIKKYAEEETGKGRPKNADLVETIDNIAHAVLESFWTDDIQVIPDESVSCWCELWLRTDSNNVKSAEQNITELASGIGIELQEERLNFPERMVLLALANRTQLQELIQACLYIAEIRKAKETPRFFVQLPNAEQAEWVDDALRRIKVDEESQVSVCVLDTGSNNGHPLLAPVLDDDDCHTVKEEWGTHDPHGHGTMMCGVAAFNDLTRLLSESGDFDINHKLESVKLLNHNDPHDPRLWGCFTFQAISRAEIAKPETRRIGCMAITAPESTDRERPSSWSGAIDKLTSGADDPDRQRRILIVSAGNADMQSMNRYPDSNKEASVHDPGQSWNAITVGAYTELTQMVDPDFRGYNPIAQAGQLSPFSTTSCEWRDNHWPIKPDIVLEGGNCAIDSSGFSSESADLSILTTGHEPTKQLLDYCNGTSCATAQAAWLAAQIQAKYPEAWPETIRGLMIHSADWPDSMRRQFISPDRLANPKKKDLRELLRCCGYGVPNLSDALYCTQNSLTIISQATMQPFELVKSEGKTKDMHVYQLPWPREVLQELGNVPVKLKVTLSYFIEPGPGEIGWKDRYRYQSHALRFDLNSPGETDEEFKKRLSKAVWDEDEKPDTNSASDRWLLGSNQRNKGSIHKDVWQDTAINLASSNLVGVYPVIGWWRERKWLGKCNEKTRYSIIVSLHTPDQNIDIYTPVATKIGVTVQV